MNHEAFLSALAELTLFPQQIVSYAQSLSKQLDNAQRNDLLDLLNREYEQFEEHNKTVQAFEEAAITELKQLKEEYLAEQAEEDEKERQAVEEKINN